MLQNETFKQRWNKLANSIFFSPINLKIYTILLIIILFLFFYNILEIKPVLVDVNDFLGLTSHLTVAYWIGFILIIFSSIRIYLDREIKESYIYLATLFIMGLFLFGPPVFAEENARYPWSYYPAGEVKHILNAGYMDLFSESPLISYNSWPSTHIISATVIYLGNIEFENLIKYMPLWWVIVFILISFNIGRLLNLSLNQSFLFSFLSLSSFWPFHNYYGPPAIAYLMYLTLFMLFIRYYDSIKERFLVFLVFCAIVITHLLSSIFVLTVYFIKSINKRKIILAAPLIVIFFAWYIYMAPQVFKMGILEFIHQAMDPRPLGVLKTGKYDPGILLTRLITFYARLSYLGILGIPVIITFIRYIAGKLSTNKNEIEVCFYWILGISMFSFFQYGVTEIDDRMYIFNIIPAAGIAILSLNRKYLVIIMLLVSVLHLPAHYGNESFDMTYQTELRGAKFFASKAPIDPRGYFYYGFPYVDYYNSSKLFSDGYLFSVSNVNDSSRINASVLDKPRYMLISRQVINNVIYNYGFNPVPTWKSKNKFNFIYSNGDFEILRNL